MPEVTFSLNKWYHWFIASIPLILFLWGIAVWVDERHQHKAIAQTTHDNHDKIANIRYIGLQMLVIEGHIRDYNRLNNPSAQDHTFYALDIDQLNNLKAERENELGIGDLPQ
jgi:hypothetical protein